MVEGTAGVVTMLEVMTLRMHFLKASPFAGSCINYMALPLRDQRHKVFDLGGLPDLMAEGLSTRMLMEHMDAQGQSLGGVRRRMKWREFILALGLHTAEEMHTAGFGLYWTESARRILNKGDLSAYWIRISIAGRSQAPEKVAVTNLFYLRGMDIGSVNVPYLLARYLRLFSSGRKQGAMISEGQFVARLAEHFGLLTEERLQGLMDRVVVPYTSYS
ncbi:hypothetical protein Tco_0676048 [Tanacetum coccineum]